MIVCKVRECPFCSKNGFCMTRTLVINAGGQCSHIYKADGSVKEDWREPVDRQFMRGACEATDAPTA